MLLDFTSIQFFFGDFFLLQKLTRKMFVPNFGRRKNTGGRGSCQAEKIDRRWCIKWRQIVVRQNTVKDIFLYFLIPWACFPPKNYVSIFFEFLLYYFNQACFKSNRTSENHVRKGKKEEGKTIFWKQRYFEKQRVKFVFRKKEKYFFGIFFCKNHRFCMVY